MDKRLIDAGKVAVDMGLGVSFKNEGYPNPFLIVTIPGPLISYKGITYRFSNVTIEMSVQNGYNSIYWIATQNPSRVLHPHMSNSDTPIFCFGDNLNELSGFILQERYAEFFARATAAVNTFSPSGAYRDIADVEVPVRACRCVTGVKDAAVCNSCKVRLPSGRSFHFKDISMSETGELIGIGPVVESVQKHPCPRCKAPMYLDEIRKSALSGEEGCPYCMVEYEGRWYTEDEIDYVEDEDGDETRMPKHLINFCHTCDRNIRRDIGHCARIDCPRGTNGDNN